MAVIAAAAIGAGGSILGGLLGGGGDDKAAKQAAAAAEAQLKFQKEIAERSEELALKARTDIRGNIAGFDEERGFFVEPSEVTAAILQGTDAETLNKLLTDAPALRAELLKRLGPDADILRDNFARAGERSERFGDIAEENAIRLQSDKLPVSREGLARSTG